jgi:hypothetical protein
LRPELGLLGLDAFDLRVDPCEGQSGISRIDLARICPARTRWPARTWRSTTRPETSLLTAITWAAIRASLLFTFPARRVNQPNITAKPINSTAMITTSLRRPGLALRASEA